MTQQARGGLLPALIDYYQRLDADPNQSVASYGFSREKVHFQVLLEPDGTLVSIDDIRERNQKGNPAPTLLVVPYSGGRSGVGLKPFFCWDNTGYVLGRDNKGKPDRALAMFEAFRDYHLSFREPLAADPGFAALCLFLKRWQPSGAETLPNWEELSQLDACNLVFKLRGQPGFVHQSKAVQNAWRNRVSAPTDPESDVRGFSLVDGESQPLARLHEPPIKGVLDKKNKPTIAPLVSFNEKAFESYGKSQSYNAPVGVLDVFRYTTAMNRLLADYTHRSRVGDATVIFWTDRESAADAEGMFAEMFGEGFTPEDKAESQRTRDRVTEFLRAAREGRLGDTVEDPDAPFYILGLSPNKARLNVRFWLSGTVRQFAERLAAHVDRLDMVGASPGDPPLVIRRLILETAREPKEIPPQLAGELARAVLAGWPYPESLFDAVIRRIRADTTINHRRAAILKAHLIRNRSREVPVALDVNNPDQAYQLGRLFAALEKTQEDASTTKINATIRDRFFASAASTPAAIFPILLRLHQHHLKKFENTGLRVNREKIVGEILGRVQRFPRHLPLTEQGLFYIGYYHQRQDFFTKRTDNNNGENE